VAPVTELEAAIHAQPDELRRLATLDVRPHTKRLAAGDQLWLVGTGSSWHAAELGAAMFARAGIDARAASSNEFVRSAPLRAGDGVIVLSHTGSTAYARASRQRALDIGAQTVSLTADGIGWPEAIETGDKERSETYTRSYTGALAILSLLAGELGAEGLGPEAVAAAADATEAALAQPDEIPQDRRLIAVAGLGPYAVTAREGALKFREAARQLAEGFDAEYLLHGNAVPLTGDDLLIVVGADADRFGERLAGVARAAGIPAVELDQPEPADELIAQIPLTARLQLLALRRAEAGGQNPDKVIVSPWDDEELWETGAP
jgi:glucosamine--fructose-6-phosphate aminotransferase (isomerizing)